MQSGEGQKEWGWGVVGYFHCGALGGDCVGQNRYGRDAETVGGISTGYEQSRKAGKAIHDDFKFKQVIIV